MAFDSSADLLFKIGADPEGAEHNIARFRAVMGKELGDLKREFSAWSQHTFGELGNFKQVVEGALAAAAGGVLALGAALIKTAERAADFAKEIEHGMHLTGASAEEMSKLKFAAERSGVAYDSLLNALVKFSRTVAMANDGHEKQVEIFRRLHISEEQLREGKEKLIPLFLRYAGEIRNISSASERNAAAIEVMGRSGAAQMPLLVKDLKAMGDAAERAGLVMSLQDVIAAKEFKLEMAGLRSQAEGFALTIGRQVLPLLVQYVAATTAAVKVSKELASVWLALRILGDDLKSTGANLLAVWGPLLNPAGGLLNLLPKLLQGGQSFKAEFFKLMDEVTLKAQAAFREGTGEMLPLSTKALKAQQQAVEDFSKELADLEALQRKNWELDLEFANSFRKEIIETHFAVLAAAAAERKASEQRVASFERELDAANRSTQEEVVGRMTASQKLSFLYQVDLDKFSEFHARRVALTQKFTDEETAILIRAYELQRQAASHRFSDELLALMNSRGWQGVIGRKFGESLKENEELYREFTTNIAGISLNLAVVLEASANLMRKSFAGLSQAMAQNVAQAIVYRKSITEAMREAAAATLASIAAESFIQSIYATALGFIRLAQHDFKAAGEAFTAAAIFGSVGVAAGIAGRATAPRPKEPAAAGQPGRGGEGGTSPGAGPGEVNPTVGGPRVTIVVNGHIVGASGIEELTDMINEAVKDRDVRLVATQVRRRGPVSQ